MTFLTYFIIVSRITAEGSRVCAAYLRTSCTGLKERKKKKECRCKELSVYLCFITSISSKRPSSRISSARREKFLNRTRSEKNAQTIGGDKIFFIKSEQRHFQ